ncbi:MAG: glycosyltransferase [Thermoplasmata archaeon]
MRVGLFSDSYYAVDGVSSYIYFLTKNLKKLGHEPYLFVPDNRYQKNDDDHIISFMSLPFPFYAGYRFALFPYFKVFKEAREKKLDIIHIHTPFFMGTSGFFSGRDMGIPIVGTFHTNFLSMNEMFNTLAIKMAWLYNMGIYWRCDQLIVPSEAIKNFLISHARKPFRNEIKIIPNGIDLEYVQSFPYSKDIKSIFGLDENKYLVTYIGRLTKDKGVYKILDAAKKLSNREDILFVIAGKGPAEHSLRENAKRLKNVKVIGYIEEKYKFSLMKDSTIFLLPSKSDVFSIAMLEAMYMKSYVIASDIGGNIDVLDNGKRGFLFDHSNANALAETILKIIKDVDMYSYIKEMAYNYVVNVANMNNVSKNISDVYKRLV